MRMSAREITHAEQADDLVVEELAAWVVRGGRVVRERVRQVS